MSLSRDTPSLSGGAGAEQGGRAGSSSGSPWRQVQPPSGVHRDGDDYEDEGDYYDYEEMLTEERDSAGGRGGRGSGSGGVGQATGGSNRGMSAKGTCGVRAWGGGGALGGASRQQA